MAGGGGSHLLRREVLPMAAAFSVEAIVVCVSIFYKAAVDTGLRYRVFMVYAYAISALVTLPLAYFCHRKSQLPPFTLGVLAKFFLLGVIGYVSESIGLIGIELSSPTMGSALSNVNPATTFVVAILLRMEILKIRSPSSQAKVVGTVLSISGALVVVLYEGPMVISRHAQPSHLTRVWSPQMNWIVGGGLIAIAYLLQSLWDILQAKFIKEYPAEFILVFWYDVSALLLALLAGIIFEPNLDAWKLSMGIQLTSVLFQGIAGTAISALIKVWVLLVKGPVYAAMFKPLSIAMSAFLGVIFLGDNLYLGCVVGSIVISIGFYTVMWGKITEENTTEGVQEENASETSPEAKVPLLKHNIASNHENSANV